QVLSRRKNHKNLRVLRELRGPYFVAVVADRGSVALCWTYGLCGLRSERARLPVRRGVRALSARAAPAGGRADRPLHAPLLPGADGRAQSCRVLSARGLSAARRRVPPVASPPGHRALAPRLAALLLASLSWRASRVVRHAVQQRGHNSRWKPHNGQCVIFFRDRCCSSAARAASARRRAPPRSRWLPAGPAGGCCSSPRIRPIRPLISFHPPSPPPRPTSCPPPSA